MNKANIFEGNNKFYTLYLDTRQSTFSLTGKLLAGRLAKDACRN